MQNAPLSGDRERVETDHGHLDARHILEIGVERAILVAVARCEAALHMKMRDRLPEDYLAVDGDNPHIVQFYIPEVLIAARTMKMAMEILEPKLVEAGVEPVGKAVMGTVKGDLHDIGKNLVVMMLKGAGFEVTDVGTDVAAEDFAAKVKQSGARIVGLSTLLTTTMPAMKETVRALKDLGLGAKIMVGGAPVTQNFADKIGADGYAPDAASAVELAKSL